MATILYMYEVEGADLRWNNVVCRVIHHKRLVEVSVAVHEIGRVVEEVGPFHFGRHGAHHVARLLVALLVYDAIPTARPEDTMSAQPTKAKAILAKETQSPQPCHTMSRNTTQ